MACKSQTSPIKDLTDSSAGLLWIASSHVNQTHHLPVLLSSLEMSTDIHLWHLMCFIGTELDISVELGVVVFFSVTVQIQTPLSRRIRQTPDFEIPWKGWIKSLRIISNSICNSVFGLPQSRQKRTGRKIIKRKMGIERQGCLSQCYRENMNSSPWFSLEKLADTDFKWARQRRSTTKIMSKENSRHIWNMLIFRKLLNQNQKHPLA